MSEIKVLIFIDLFKCYAWSWIFLSILHDATDHVSIGGRQIQIIFRLTDRLSLLYIRQIWLKNDSILFRLVFNFDISNSSFLSINFMYFFLFFHQKFLIKISALVSRYQYRSKIYQIWTKKSKSLQKKLWTIIIPIIIPYNKIQHFNKEQFIFGANTTTSNRIWP